MAEVLVDFAEPLRAVEEQQHPRRPPGCFAWATVRGTTVERSMFASCTLMRKQADAGGV